MPSNGLHSEAVIFIGNGDTSQVEKAYDSYKTLAKEWGMSLAGEDDHNKAFKPETGPVICLGVMYDTKSFTWWIRDDKLLVMLHMIKKACTEPKISVGHIMSLVGRLLDVRLLVPNSKWQLGYILGCVPHEYIEEKSKMMILSQDVKDQLTWWSVHLRLAREKSTICGPQLGIAPCRTQAWSDAAGGNPEKLMSSGVGGIIPPNAWFYMPWPESIQVGIPNSRGVIFSNKLTCLEAFGGLVCACIAPDLIRNWALEVFIDNQGTVDIFSKGYSCRDEYSYTMVKALYDVCQGLNAQIKVTKIRRCSTALSYVADLLSKASIREARQIVPTMDIEPSKIPRTLIHWIKDPRPDLHLGREILLEMARDGHEVVI